MWGCVVVGLSAENGSLAWGWGCGFWGSVLRGCVGFCVGCGCGAVWLWGCGCGAGVVVAVRLCLLEIWNILRAVRLVGLWGCAREGGGPRGGLRAVCAEMRARGARRGGGLRAGGCAGGAVRGKLPGGCVGACARGAARGLARRGLRAGVLRVRGLCAGCAWGAVHAGLRAWGAAHAGGLRAEGCARGAARGGLRAFSWNTMARRSRQNFTMIKSIWIYALFFPTSKL